MNAWAVAAGDAAHAHALTVNLLALAGDHTAREEAFLPAPDTGLCLARPPHDLRRAAASAGEQNDASPPNVILGLIAIRGDRLKASAIRRGNLEGNSVSSQIRLRISCCLAFNPLTT